MLIPTLAALSAAVLFALATALQHRSAGLISDAGISSTGGLGGFVAKTLRHPLWIVAPSADLAGFGLQAWPCGMAAHPGPATARNRDCLRTPSAGNSSSTAIPGPMNSVGRPSWVSGWCLS